MTIWILTIVLLASLAGIGLRQGAIRVACSLLGIIFGALLAAPVGHLLSPIVRAVGLKNPVWSWSLGPLLGFLIILTIFKIVGATVNRKVGAYYHHKVPDLQCAMWERLNQRLGLCLGMVNGMVYLVLVTFAINTPAYWTYQLGQSPAGENLRTMRMLNRLGADLQRTGMNKVAGAVRTIPESYYDAADIVGLIYKNPTLTDRLSRYPDFISLAAKPEFQELANDSELVRMVSEQSPISDLLNQSKVKAILNNPTLLESVWSMLTPDLKDLRSFLESGKSAKYDPEKILGKWTFSRAAATAAFRKSKPTVSLTEMRSFRQWMSAFANTAFAAGRDHDVVLTGVPTPQSDQKATLRGDWQSDGTDYYKLKLNAGDAGNQEVEASIESGRLTINFTGYSLAFIRTE